MSHSSVNYETEEQQCRLTDFPKDGHNDWMHLIRAYYDFQLDERFDADKSLVGHVDVQRLVEGKAGAVFWSLFVNWQVEILQSLYLTLC